MKGKKRKCSGEMGRVGKSREGKKREREGKRIGKEEEKGKRREADRKGRRKEREADRKGRRKERKGKRIGKEEKRKGIAIHGKLFTKHLTFNNFSTKIIYFPVCDNLAQQTITTLRSTHIYKNNNNI